MTEFALLWMARLGAAAMVFFCILAVIQRSNRLGIAGALCGLLSLFCAIGVSAISSVPQPSPLFDRARTGWVKIDEDPSFDVYARELKGVGAIVYVHAHRVGYQSGPAFIPGVTVDARSQRLVPVRHSGSAGAAGPMGAVEP